MVVHRESRLSQGADQGDRRRLMMQPEWPTVAVAVVCYGGFATVVMAADVIGYWITVPALVIVLTLQSSLQHEIIHGHPFGRRRWNELLGFPPIGLLVPFERFRDTHLAHHQDVSLTDPYEDPETNYVDPQWWARRSSLCRRLLTFNNTLLGRMLIGPAIGLVRLYGADLRAMFAGERAVWRAYGRHVLGLGLLALWWANFASMPWWLYLISAYFAISLLRIRTFLEHCAQEPVAHRTAVVEDRGLLSYLFLKNNFHAVHHAHPGIPWYRLERTYHAGRDAFLSDNNGYVYRSYWSVMRRHLLRPKDAVVHPFYGRRPDLSVSRHHSPATQDRVLDH